MTRRTLLHLSPAVNRAVDPRARARPAADGRGARDRRQRAARARRRQRLPWGSDAPSLPSQPPLPAPLADDVAAILRDLDPAGAITGGWTGALR